MKIGLLEEATKKMGLADIYINDGAPLSAAKCLIEAHTLKAKAFGTSDKAIAEDLDRMIKKVKDEMEGQSHD